MQAPRSSMMQAPRSKSSLPAPGSNCMLPRARPLQAGHPAPGSGARRASAERTCVGSAAGRLGAAAAAASWPAGARCTASSAALDSGSGHVPVSKPAQARPSRQH